MCVLDSSPRVNRVDGAANRRYVANVSNTSILTLQLQVSTACTKYEFVEPVSFGSIQRRTFSVDPSPETFGRSSPQPAPEAQLH